MSSLSVLLFAPVRTAEVVRTYLQMRWVAGTLVPAKLSAAMGFKPKSGMMSMLLRGERDFPMDRIDQAAEFFGYGLAEDFVRDARLAVKAQTVENSPTPKETPRSERTTTSLSADRFPVAHQTGQRKVAGGGKKPR